MAKTYIYKDTNLYSSIFDYVLYKDVKVPNSKLLLVRGILSQYLSPDIVDKKYVNAIDIYWNNPIVKPKNSPETNLGIYTTSDLLNYIKDSFSYNNINTGGMILKSELDDYMRLSSLKTDIDYYILQINNILNRKFSYIDKTETNPGYNSIERGRTKKCLCKYDTNDNVSNSDDLSYKFISFKKSENPYPYLKLDWEVRIDNKASENDNNDDTYYSGTNDFSQVATLSLPENRDNRRWFNIVYHNTEIFSIEPTLSLPVLSDKIVTIKLKQHHDENDEQLGNLEDTAELTYECTFLTNNANNDVDTRLVVNDIQYKGQSLYDTTYTSGRIEKFNDNIFDDATNYLINIKCGDRAFITVSYYYYFRWYDHEGTEQNDTAWHSGYIFRDPSNEYDQVDKYIILSRDIEHLKTLALTSNADKKIIIKNLNLLNEEKTGLNPNIKFYNIMGDGIGSSTYKDENNNEKTINLTNLFEYNHRIIDSDANASNLSSKIVTGYFDLDLGDVFSRWSHWKATRVPKYETKLLADKLALNLNSEGTWESTIEYLKFIPEIGLYYIYNLGSEYYYDSDHHPMYATYFPGINNIGKVIRDRNLFDIKFNIGPDELINYFSFISTKLNYYNDVLYNSQENNYKIYTHAPIITYRINRQLFSFVYTGDPDDPNTELIFVKSRNGKASDFFEDYTTEDNSNFTAEQDNNIRGSRILYKYSSTKHEKIDYIEIDSDSVEITTNIYVYYNQRMKGFKVGGDDSTQKSWVDDNINWWKHTSYAQTYNLTSNSGNIVDVKDLFGLSEYNKYDYIYRLFNQADNTVKKLFHGEDFTYGNPDNYMWNSLYYYDDEGNFAYSYYFNGKNSWLSKVGQLGENILVEDYLEKKYYGNPAIFIKIRRK